MGAKAAPSGPFTAATMACLVLVGVGIFYLGRVSVDLTEVYRPVSFLSGASGNAGGSLEPVPFYFPPDKSEFRKIATSHNPVTDKVGALRIRSNLQHTYDTLYSKYLEPDNRRLRRMKVLEIGLGCNMGYGPGASAKLWKEYLPNADIWFGEYDAKCMQAFQGRIDELGIRVVTGDQADNATLARWVEETGGDFDIIIDDGGHFNHQIFNSFATLWHKALKPGGVYFIEDLRFSREAPWRGAPGSPIVAQVISDWVNSIMTVVRYGTMEDLSNPETMRPSDKAYKTGQQLNAHGGEGAYLATYKLPLGAKTVECAAEMCAVVKCTADDHLCPDGLAGPILA